MIRTCSRTGRARVWPRFVLVFLGLGVLAGQSFAQPASPASFVPSVLPAPSEVIPASHEVRPVSGQTGDVIREIVGSPTPDGVVWPPPMPTGTTPSLGSPMPVTAAPPGMAVDSPPLGSPLPVVPTVDCAACDPQKDDGKNWEMIWNNGLYFQTKNKDFTFHTGATLQYDGAWYTGGTDLQTRPNLRDGVGGTGRFFDGTNFRRGRFNVDGTLYHNVDYRFEIEFANGIGFSPVGTQGNVVASSVVNSPGPTDAWITIKDVPVLGNLRIGNQKEWFSLEHLESYRYLQYLERSYLFDFSQPTAFNNGRCPGVSVFRTWADSRVFSAVGFYKNISDLLGFGIGDGQYALTGRLAALPLWNPEEQQYWHVGGAMSLRDPVDDQVQIRVRDDIRNAPFPLLNLLLNTGQIPTAQQQLFNIETAYVDGPWTMQAEYTANVLYGVSTTRAPDGPNLGTYVFHGAYGSVMYFLTGESRSWNTQYFFYNRVVPKKNFAFKKDGLGVDGWGAWEIGARYTYLNVTDKTIEAGMLNACTLGLNWYLNPNCKFQFNYDYTYRTHNADPLAHGAIHAFGSRFSLDF